MAPLKLVWRKPPPERPIRQLQDQTVHEVHEWPAFAPRSTPVRSPEEDKEIEVPSKRPRLECHAVEMLNRESGQGQLSCLLPGLLGMEEEEKLILSRLTPWELMTAKLVSKAWLSRLTRYIGNKIQTSSHWLVVGLSRNETIGEEHRFAIFDPSDDSWRLLPLPCPVGYKLDCGMNGIVILSLIPGKRTFSMDDMAVGNPVTGQWHSCQKPLCHYYLPVPMGLVASGNEASILALTHPMAHHSLVASYNPCTEEMRFFGARNLKCLVSVGFTVDHKKQVLYFLERGGLNVVAVDLSNEAGKVDLKKTAPLPDVNPRALLHCGVSLLLLGERGDSLCIFKLQRRAAGKYLWKAVTDLPVTVDRFSHSCTNAVDCIWIVLQPEPELMKFDLTNRAWTRHRGPPAEGYRAYASFPTKSLSFQRWNLCNRCLEPPPAVS